MNIKELNEKLGNLVETSEDTDMYNECIKKIEEAFDKHLQAIKKRLEYRFVINPSHVQNAEDKLYEVELEITKQLEDIKDKIYNIVG